MAFGTRHNLLGAAVGIMETSEKWQSPTGGDQPPVWNALECTKAKFSARAEVREICTSCGAFTGPPGQPFFLGRPRAAAGSGRLGVCWPLGGCGEGFLHGWHKHGHEHDGCRGRKGGGQRQCSHRDTLQEQELPFLTALLIKELLFLAL